MTALRFARKGQNRTNCINGILWSHVRDGSKCVMPDGSRRGSTTFKTGRHGSSVPTARGLRKSARALDCPPPVRD
jgi:hypothetical protein